MAVFKPIVVVIFMHESVEENLCYYNSNPPPVPPGASPCYLLYSIYPCTIEYYDALWVIQSKQFTRIIATNKLCKIITIQMDFCIALGGKASNIYHFVCFPSHCTLLPLRPLCSSEFVRTYIAIFPLASLEVGTLFLLFGKPLHFWWLSWLFLRLILIWKQREQEKQQFHFDIKVANVVRLSCVYRFLLKLNCVHGGTMEIARGKKCVQREH